MAGAIRFEKHRLSKPYERRVRFQESGQESGIASEATMTPKRVRSAAPTLTAGAADHKSRKRHGARAARRRSDEYEIITDDCDYRELFARSEPRTPVRNRHYKSQPLLNGISAIPSSSLLEDQDIPVSSSPFGKTCGMPDVSDFEEMPSSGISFIARALPSTVAELFSELEDMHAKIIAQEQKGSCHCVELERENEELKRRYRALFNKHQTLVQMMKEMCAKPEPTVEAHSQDGMICDADDKRSSSSTAELYGFEPFTPIPSLSSPMMSPSASTSSSSSSNTPRTPAIIDAAPTQLWLTAEDESGIYHNQPADHWSTATELEDLTCSGMAEDIQNLTQALADLWKDCGAAVTATSGAKASSLDADFAALTFNLPLAPAFDL